MTLMLLHLSRGAMPDFVAKDPIAVQIDTYVSRHVPFGFSGCVLVANSKGILLSKGYGMADIESGLRNTPATEHSLGSVTKQFTATAILKLEEMGKLHVEDSLGKLLPGVPEDKAPITLDQILHHTSGLVANVGGDYEKSTREELLRKAFAEPLLSKPGEEYAYSNVGYSVLAAVVEQVSGKPYETFLAENLLSPVGMKHTGYRLPDWSGATLASAYARGERTPPNTQLEYPTWNVMGNGEILSTTEDMYRWVKALLSGSVLSKASLEKMWTPGQSGYGYGWSIDDNKFGRLVNHDGASHVGTGCFVSFFPERGTIVVVFCNRDAGRYLASAGWEQQLPLMACGEKLPMPPAIKGQVSKSPIGAGTFTSAVNGDFLLSNEGGVETVAPLTAKCAQVLLPSRFVKDPAPLTIANETVQDFMSGRLDRLKDRLKDGADAAAVYKAFQNAMQGFEEDYGKLISIEPVYGLTSPKHSGEFEAVFQLKFANHSGYMSCYWQDGKYASHNRSVRDLPVRIWAAGVETNRLVLYDLETGNSAELTYDRRAKRMTSADGKLQWEKSADSR